MHYWLKLVFLNFVAQVHCFQKPIVDRRGPNRQSDQELMSRYWREVLPLGFFINQGAAETGESVRLALRDKIQHVVDDGHESHETVSLHEEGSGGEVRRDDIAKPATEQAADETSTAPSNEQVSTEESGKLAADYKAENAETKSPDDSEKEKVRRSITCQGQKEWLQCDGPYELIRIRNAFWGRDNDYTCTRSGITHGLRSDKNCAQDESNTMTKIREACDNENVCEVVASPIYFDKTDCPDIYKYLKLEWECARSESRIKEIF